MADAVAECQAEFPGHIVAPFGGGTSYPVTFDCRKVEASLDFEDAAAVSTGHVSFTMLRPAYAAAGIRQESFLARASAPTVKLHVTGIEDDDAFPFVRITAEEAP